MIFWCIDLCRCIYKNTGSLYICTYSNNVDTIVIKPVLDSQTKCREQDTHTHKHLPLSLHINTHEQAEGSLASEAKNYTQHLKKKKDIHISETNSMISRWSIISPVNSRAARGDGMIDLLYHLLQMSSVCAVASDRSHQSETVRVHWLLQSVGPRPRSACSLTDSQCFCQFYSSMSEHVGGRRRNGTVAVHVCLVCRCPVSPCIYLWGRDLLIFTERTGLCYCCNEPGICWPPVLSARWTGRWSCRVWSPPLPHPSASSAPSARPRPGHDWPASFGATCRSVRVGTLRLGAATVGEQEDGQRPSQCSGQTSTASARFFKGAVLCVLQNNQVTALPSVVKKKHATYIKYEEIWLDHIKP